MGYRPRNKSRKSKWDDSIEAYIILQKFKAQKELVENELEKRFCQAFDEGHRNESARLYREYILTKQQNIEKEFALSNVYWDKLHKDAGIELPKSTLCKNTKVKTKSFNKMSKEEKIKFVNKQIDDLIDFIETNKQAKYRK